MPEITDIELSLARLRTCQPVTTARITEGLDLITELKAQHDLLTLQKQALIDNVLTAEIKTHLAEIDAEFADPFQEIAERIAEVEGLIRDEVIAHGATVKGAHLMAVYMKGRVSWDSQKLDGMMILLPKLAEARKVGDPSVQFRKV